MGMLSEKMSTEGAQLEESSSDPESSHAHTESTNTTEAAQEGVAAAQRASPVSSEDSVAERLQSSTMGTSTAPEVSTNNTSNTSNGNQQPPTPSVLQQAADGIAVLANSVAAHADPSSTCARERQEFQPANESPSHTGGTARAYRSVSREELDGTGVAPTALNQHVATSGGTDGVLAESYQSLEARARSDQSVKSTSQQEEGSAEQPAHSSDSLDPKQHDGPPQFITTKPAATGNGKRSGKVRRRGKWTVEEEAYVARVIQDFNAGFLDAPAGTTLRTYLSDKLNCDPMRITKKFTGEACIGKRVFHPAIRSSSNAAAIDKAQSELEALEQRWRSRLEMQQRESAKKAAASAAAAAAAANSAHGMSGDALASGVSQNPILQTATWLDRAKSLTSLPPTNIEGLPRSEVMHQMAEVQRLLSEGSTMQRTSAELSHLVDQSSLPTAAVANSGTQSPPPEPADKRLRTGAEDAEALVGFLRSVRASAASGQEF